MQRQDGLPAVFCELINNGCIAAGDVVNTQDGFYAIYKPLSEILKTKGLCEFTLSSGQTAECDRFFDDWFLYALPTGAKWVYSLFKLREQENELSKGILADGDAPGVTVCFIEFSVEHLIKCLNAPTAENAAAFGREVNRVVAYGGQRHNKDLKDYFKSPESTGAYLIASLFVKRMASFACDGMIKLPVFYKQLANGAATKKTARLLNAVKELNALTADPLCNDERIRLSHPEHLTEEEALAILITHTGNTTAHSFAAEVEYHARFLFTFAKIPIPFLKKSIYSSAIRADLTVEDSAQGLRTPYYDPNSKIVKRQLALHSDYKLSF